MKNEQTTDLQAEATLQGAVPMGSVPMGTVVAFLLNKANIPAGWLPCDGSNIPSQYQQLITALGSNNTPNLSGRTLAGTGTGTDTAGMSINWSLGNTGGEYQHKLSIEEMPSHQHFGWGEHGTNNWGGSTGYSTNNGYTGSNKTDSDNNLFGSTYAGGIFQDAPIATTNGSVAGVNPGITAPHNNMQPYYVVNYIIYTGVNS